MRKPKSFLKIPTYSEGKRITEKQLDQVLQARGIKKIAKTGWAIYLVGNPETSYARHYHRSVEELGFAPTRTLFAEREKATYDGLTEFKVKHGYKNPVVFGDIIRVIKELIQQGQKVIYVEADGTDSYGQLDWELYNLCVAHKIPFMSINGSLRSQSKVFKLEAARLGMRRTVDKRNPQQGLRYDTKRIIQAIAKQRLAKSYEFKLDSYRGRKGRANMYISTIINKDLNLE